VRRDIKIRFGLTAAFDYVVAEKLLDFASAAADHPEFARELPRFVSEVRRMFTPEEIRTHIARVEREQAETIPTPPQTMMNCPVKAQLPSPIKPGDLQSLRTS